jgi:DNA-binding SARP family transcriptional activator
MGEYERMASAEDVEFGRELELGHHQTLVPVLIRAVEAEPLREHRRCLLMLALYRCGRQLEALRTSLQLRETLAELGREPTAESKELEAAIALERPELDWTDPDAIAN